MIFMKGVIKFKCIMAAQYGELYSHFPQKLCIGQDFIKRNYLSFHQGSLGRVRVLTEGKAKKKDTIQAT
jgi:hypothetical protein